MTDTRKDIHRAAARAALGVPGVAALQPSLADRLALAAARVQEAVTATGTGTTSQTTTGTTSQTATGTGTASHSEQAGIRTQITPEGSWHVEVRCVLKADRRVVATARQVREQVRTAVTACLVQHGATAPVTVRVMVTVTRTV
ncbi:hypothetical protein [Streptomyces sp. NPDC054849]